MDLMEETEFSEEGQSTNLGETLKEYLRIVRRRIWLILIITGTTTGLALLVVLEPNPTLSIHSRDCD